MELNILERFTLLGLLPKEGSFMTLKLIRDLSNKVGFSAEELTEYEITQTGESVHWNTKKDKGKSFNFKIKEIELVNEQLKSLDIDKKLTNQHFSIYEKFNTEQN